MFDKELKRPDILGLKKKSNEFFWTLLTEL